MRTKIKALWCVLTSRYFVVFTTKSKKSKWTTVNACLHPEEHSEIVNIIRDANSNDGQKKWTTTAARSDAIHWIYKHF